MTPSAETRFVTVPGGDQVFAEAFGAPDAPVLCLIPGLGGVGSFFSRIVPALAKTHRVITHDHRGTGRSTKALIDYSIPQMAADLLAVMDAFGVSSAILLGHSTGGAIAQTVALDAPARVSGLILSSTWAAPDAYFRALFEVRRDVLQTLGPAAYQRLGTLLLRPPAITAGAPEDLHLDDIAALERLHDPAIVSSRIGAILAHDRRVDLPRLRCPALITCSADDVITPPHLSGVLAELIPGARLTLAKGGGHFLPQTQPECFLSLIQPFIADLEQVRSTP